ncbi:MAG: class I SAM-dependent methyltransferase [Nitrospiraceae bacterium]|nr:MAG: class I SAM-dependent methyltransferase [Nitrospiraceae bacterium]
MIEELYTWVRRKCTAPDEQDEPSSGYWQHTIRDAAFTLCVPNKGTILEIGCGEGLFLQKFVRGSGGAGLCGIDISPEQLLKAKKRSAGRAGLFRADACSLPFTDSVFDSIVCINVFMNMPLDDMLLKSLQEIRRVCKKGGRIIFDIRNGLNPIVRMKYGLVKYYDSTMDSTALRMHTFSSIKAKLNALDLTIDGKTPLGFPGGMFAPIIMVEAVKN